MAWCASARGWRTQRWRALATRPHPIHEHEISALQRQVDTLLGAVASSRLAAPDRRDEARSRETAALDWIKPRSVWLVVAPEMREMATALRQQIDFFGFQTREIPWSEAAPLAGDLPLAVLFIPATGGLAHEKQHAYMAITPTAHMSESFRNESGVLIAKTGSPPIRNPLCDISVDSKPTAT